MYAFDELHYFVAGEIALQPELTFQSVIFRCLWQILKQKLLKFSFLPEQFFVSAFLTDDPILKYNDPVHLGQVRQAVGH